MVIFTQSEFTLGSSATECQKFTWPQRATNAAWGERSSSLGTAVRRDAFFGLESLSCSFLEAGRIFLPTLTFSSGLEFW